MPKISIKYFGMLRQIVGKREEKVEMKASSNIAELVLKLSEHHGKKFSDFVFDSEGNIKEGFSYAINGATVNPSKFKSIKCSHVSEFVILPPISGGN